MDGIVTEFDAHVGLGVVKADAGESFPFHCVNIADGSRTIDAGARVSFETFDHPRGRTEARAITSK